MFEAGKKYRSKEQPDHIVDCIYVAPNKENAVFTLKSGYPFVVGTLAFKFWEKYVPKKKGWMNVFQGVVGYEYGGRIWPTRKEADENSYLRTDCIEVEYIDTSK